MMPMSLLRPNMPAPLRSAPDGPRFCGAFTRGRCTETGAMLAVTRLSAGCWRPTCSGRRRGRHRYHPARVASVITLKGRSPNVGRKQMTTISLRQADDIADRVLEGGVKLESKPLTVAVLDAGGHLVVSKRQDGSGIARLQIAQGKARGALGMGMGSRAIADLAADRPFFVAGAASLEGVELVPAAGGVLVRDEAGAGLGARWGSWGISGVGERWG